MSAAVPPSHPQLAVSAAIFREDKILLVRRARSPAKGFYSLPGGRVEFGESLHAALHREVAEETALKIEIIGLAGWREVLPGTSGGGGALSDHVICGALEFRRAGPERGTRRFRLALTQCARRSQSHRWPARGDTVGLGPAPGLKHVPPHLASSALKRHITDALCQSIFWP